MNRFEVQGSSIDGLSEKARDSLLVALAARKPDVSSYRNALLTAMWHEAGIDDLRQFAEVYITDAEKKEVYTEALAMLEEQMSNPDALNALTESAPTTLTLADPIFRRYRDTNPEEYYRLVDALYAMYTTGGSETIISELEQGRLHKTALNQLLDLAHSNPEQYVIDESDSVLLKTFMAGSELSHQDTLSDDLVAFIDGSDGSKESGNDAMTRAA